MRSGKISIAIAGVVLGFLLWAPAAPADGPLPGSLEWHNIPSNEYRIYRAYGPIYDPHTKSYFELHNFVSPGGGTTGDNWPAARRLARESSYKGVRGQLALVKDYETHEFLLKHFNGFTDAWIGLQLKCKPLKAYWIDGQPLKADKFNAWDLEQWYNTDINCIKAAQDINYMGVYYRSLDHGFRWRAAGPRKKWEFFFVQYPTGER